jgi:general secretion pathway protein A
MTPELLEEVRLMGNYDHAGDKLLQILLIGQSEIDTLLNRPDLRQLKQRICVRLTIEPLARTELDYYIRYRWTKAGGQAAPFPTEVSDRIFYWSGGIPRLVNSLADNALMLAFADNCRNLRVEYINSSAQELQLEPMSNGARVAGLETKAVEAKAPLEDFAPVAAARLSTLERYEQPKKSAPFFMRLAGKRA